MQRSQQAAAAQWEGRKGREGRPALNAAFTRATDVSRPLTRDPGLPCPAPPLAGQRSHMEDRHTLIPKFAPPGADPGLPCQVRGAAGPRAAARGGAARPAHTASACWTTLCCCDGGLLASCQPSLPFAALPAPLSGMLSPLSWVKAASPTAPAPTLLPPTPPRPHCSITCRPLQFAAVYDGHSSHHGSEHASRRVHQYIAAQKAIPDFAASHCLLVLAESLAGRNGTCHTDELCGSLPASCLLCRLAAHALHECHTLHTHLPPTHHPQHHPSLAGRPRRPLQGGGGAEGSL